MFNINLKKSIVMGAILFCSFLSTAAESSSLEINETIETLIHPSYKLMKGQFYCIKCDDDKCVKIPCPE
ncbi:hypothetical protein [Pseudoalteromonas aliena]|uniref:hypothetical protein n=1 Tax=Pseudoalteromonas aliena TaxID=247523 RepID=UPI002494209B|nr:hypothetical protein [Pseudoalteromonas aliena]